MLNVSLIANQVKTIPDVEQNWPEMRTPVLAQTAFRDAAPIWLESRRPYLAPRTLKDYDLQINMLAKFFGDMRLTEISADDIRSYQRMRMSRAGGSCINKECSILQQMLKRIGRWNEIERFYQPLPLPKESPHRPLTPAEEERLHRVGCSNPAWDVAYCTFCISINTSCGPSEMRHLRLMDVDFAEQTIYIQPKGAKNRGRIRRIALNSVALRAIEYLWERAKKLGCREPEHYLIPFRKKKGAYDPERPAMSWRYALNEMFVAAEITDISAYAFRHHALTKLVENPKISLETVRSIAGHISPLIINRYSHVRLDAQRAAVEALERIAPKPARAKTHRPAKLAIIKQYSEGPYLLKQIQGAD
ncbi:MAG: tyrosine-type recombinase/integrase [Candidatus Sulfotelmatobacter sp.]